MDSNNQKVPPLASIDEDVGDEEDEDTIVMVSNEMSTFLRTNVTELNPPKYGFDSLFLQRTAMTTFPQQSNGNDSLLLSPISDISAGDRTPTTSSTALALTPTMAKTTSNNNMNDYSDEYYGGCDTGFFTSSQTSSKRSSLIDLDVVSFNNSSQFSSSISSTNHRISNDQQKEEEEEEDEEEDELYSEMNPANPIREENSEGNHSSSDGRRGSSSLSISGSLEDLVNSFDEKVKNCLKNFNENVGNLAPVQIRSTEEVIKNRPAWWTLTGNYGNILPIDWELLSPQIRTGNGSSCEIKSSISLNVLVPDNENMDTGENQEVRDEEEDGRLKELINSCLDLDSETPIKLADEVLKEIDDIIAGKCGTVGGGGSQYSGGSRSSSISYDYIPLILRSTFYRFSLDKLKTFNADQLEDLCEDLESRIGQHSQELVDCLAERDELEFEKEIKNTFLSLLVKIQKRRKEYHRKHDLKNENDQNLGPHYRKRRYLTTIIPYSRKVASISSNSEMLQTLIKILRAMIDDSPAVPTMLTDYILRFVCPAIHDHKQMNGKSDLGKDSETASLSSWKVDNSNEMIIRPTNSGHYRPKSSPLNQTLNNTIKAARRSFSFRKSALFSGGGGASFIGKVTTGGGASLVAAPSAS